MFNTAETNLIFIYNPGSRSGLMAELEEMKGYLTPEEADLAGSGKADVAIVNTGVAITVETTVHPVNVNTYASEIVLPSFERMDEVAVMKVTA